MSDATSIDFLAGRGDEARLAFHLAGATWDDGRLATPGDSRRATTPYSGLPPMTGDRGSLDPVTAILLHIGLQLGLHPLEKAEAERHESIMRSVEQLRVELVDATRPSIDAARSWTAEVSPRLGAGPFLGGADIAIADLRLFAATTHLYEAGGELRAAVEGSPALMAHRASVAGHDKVAEYFRGS